MPRIQDNLKKKIVNPKLNYGQFSFSPGHQKGKETAVLSYERHKQKRDLEHNRIQTNIYKQLSLKFGKNNVGTEQLTGLGSRVDLVVRIKKNNKFSYIFYEIKTSNSLRACIREGLSQLLEYAYFPKNDNASKLIVISSNKINSNNQAYLRLLRERFNIPIYYQYYNPEIGKLEEKEF